MTDRLTYTVPEVAQLLGISRGVAYESVRRGEIPSLRLGRRVLVARAALDGLLNDDDRAPTRSLAHTTPAVGAPENASTAG